MCSHHTSKGGPNLKFEFAKKNGGGPNCGISIQSGLLTLSVSASLFVLRLPCKALHIPTYQQVQRRFFRPPSQLLLRPHTALSSLDEISAALPLTISRPSSYQSCFSFFFFFSETQWFGTLLLLTLRRRRSSFRSSRFLLFLLFWFICFTYVQLV